MRELMLKAALRDFIYSRSRNSDERWYVLNNYDSNGENRSKQWLDEKVTEIKAQVAEAKAMLDELCK